MKHLNSFVIVFVFSMSLFFDTQAAEKNVHSLDQVPSNINSENGTIIYQQQMNGATLPDGFGTTLPKGISAGRIIQRLLPKADTTLATLTGMKRWPYAPQRYIAIASIAPDKKSRDEVLSYNNGKPMIAPWLMDAVPGYRIGLGVFQYDTLTSKDSLLGKLTWSEDSLNPLATSWQNSALDSPVNIPENGEKLRPKELYNFDFGSFKISDSITAFGIRSGYNEGYAGGGANFQMLTLFALIKGRIEPILSEPMYCFLDIAGEWHDDGTRDHDLIENENIVIMLPHKTSGYYDLKIKTKGNQWSKVFKWDSESSSYLP